MQSVAKNLREEIYYEYYGQILRKSKIFALNFSAEFIDELSLNMKEMTLAPNEILFREGDLDDKLYFITRGEI